MFTNPELEQHIKTINESNNDSEILAAYELLKDSPEHLDVLETVNDYWNNQHIELHWNQNLESELLKIDVQDPTQTIQKHRSVVHGTNEVLTLLLSLKLVQHHIIKLDDQTQLLEIITRSRHKILELWQLAHASPNLAKNKLTSLVELQVNEQYLLSHPSFVNLVDQFGMTREFISNLEPEISEICKEVGVRDYAFPSVRYEYFDYVTKSRIIRLLENIYDNADFDLEFADLLMESQHLLGFEIRNKEYKKIRKTPIRLKKLIKQNIKYLISELDNSENPLFETLHGGYISN